MRTLPEVGCSKVPAMASRVDFPDPDGPTTATNSPSSTAIDTERSATTGGDPGCSFVTSSQLERRHCATTTLVPGPMPGPEIWTREPVNTPVVTPIR